MMSAPVLLAFDTATETMSIALQAHGRLYEHEGAGGAQASAALLPAIQALLEQAGLALAELDAIAFGRGPGAFTGLRTACSVAQGLAFGAGLPVLPVDTLMAVAEDARLQSGATDVWAVMDARMDEVYAAHYRFEHADQRWHTLQAPALYALGAPGALELRGAACVAGNALSMYAPQLSVGAALQLPQALPRARAIVQIATGMWARGEAVDAAQAVPLYIRDKVALTTAERAAVKAAQAAAEGSR